MLGTVPECGALGALWCASACAMDAGMRGCKKQQIYKQFKTKKKRGKVRPGGS